MKHKKSSFFFLSHLWYSVRAREWIRDQHFLHFLAKLLRCILIGGQVSQPGR
uniref:Uncharacterized protein n=1 Tax=Myoviridae sp. ct5Tq8 TaxID=2826612 RepID=A0A8S5NEK6_9CAUD|nr:MAG TPA: hypothetical protein [Myoviridae sp. ct5Tq8]